MTVPTVTFKEYIDRFADPKIRKEINSIGIIGYVLAGINLLAAVFTNIFILLDVLLILGLSLGIHIGKSRICAILLCAYGAYNVIFAIIQTGKPAGYLILLLGICAVIQFHKARKQYTAFCLAQAEEVAAAMNGQNPSDVPPTEN